MIRLDGAHFSPLREPPCTGAGWWREGGACGACPRRRAAREAGPAQEGVHPQGCARSPEARPLRTTAELWQVHPKGTRSGREAGVLNRSAGLVRTEIAAWDAGRPAFYYLEAGRSASRSPAV